ncbi:MAG: ABC transporter substrate-binding protein [Acidobacteriota bacterium]|nr:ABC transporter substrate-binding protein [Acidobacteriota bacterium]
MRTTLRVLTWCVVAALSFTLAGCRKKSDSGLIVVRLQTDWYPQPEHGGFYTALTRGYYRQAGLDVQILPGGPYVTPEKQVSVGAAEFGMSSSDRIVQAVDNGQPLLAVGATMQHDPQAVMVHAASDVHSFPDLAGHSVAIMPGATWFQYIVGRYGLTTVKEKPATLSVANFLADPDYIQQIFITSEPFYVQKAGVPFRTLLISDTGYDPYRVFFTSTTYAQQHPEVVRKFVQASLRGWQDYLQDSGPAHAMIQKLNPALDPALMQYSYQALRDGHFVDGATAGTSHLGQLQADRWQAMVKQLSDLKVTHTQIDPASLYTTQFLSP